MDLHIPYWDETDNLKVQYYVSSFLGHFKPFHKPNDRSKALYQISIDGPSVNLKFFKEFAEKFKEGHFHSLAHIDSSSLHIVHGAFKTGI